MDTAFSKMAAAWLFLLVLTSVFNLHLLLPLPRQNETDNQSWDQLATHPVTPLMLDRTSNMFTAVATRTSDHLAEATAETEAPTESGTIATTLGHDDSSWPTDQDDTHAAENQQPTSGWTTAHSTPGEVETTEMTIEATTEDSTLFWHEMSTALVMMTASNDTPTPPAENVDATETRTKAAHPVVTTKAAETSAASTQHTGLSTSEPSSTTNATRAALIPRVNPGGRPPVTEPAEVQPSPTEAKQVPVDTGGFPCVTGPTRKDGLVSQCLIAIASLAAVATIFMVSTTILCTKLSSSKYRYRMNAGYGTEMVCISALLPDGNGSHGRPRIPRSNGALIPNVEDSEGDDLTLHSFLPETERGS